MRARQRGSAILEAGLICTAFLFLMLVAIDIGRALFLYQTLTERVRAAARYGSVKAFTPDAVTQTQNVVLYNDANGRTGSGVFGLQRANVSVTRAVGSVIHGIPDQLTVRVSDVNYSLFTPLVARRGSIGEIRITLPMETP